MEVKSRSLMNEIWMNSHRGGTMFSFVTKPGRNAAFVRNLERNGFLSDVAESEDARGVRVDGKITDWGREYCLSRFGEPPVRIEEE